MDGGLKWYNSPATGDWSLLQVWVIIRCEDFPWDPIGKAPGKQRQIAAPCRGCRHLMAPWCFLLASYGKQSFSWMKKCGCLPQILGLSVEVPGWHISNMAGFNLDGPEVHAYLKHLLNKLDLGKMETLKAAELNCKAAPSVHFSSLCHSVIFKF